MKDFTLDNLSNELSIKKTLARIRCVRKTIYIVPKEMISTVFAATRDMIDVISDRHCKYLGVSEQQYEEISKKIMGIIRGRGLTTKEIKQVLNTTLNVSPIVNLMCDQGLLIRGIPKKGWKSNIHTYYRFDEYFPDVNLHEVDETRARELVVRQYLAAYDPVTVNDIVWWTGFPKGQIKMIVDNLQDDLSHIKILDMKEDFLILNSDKTSLSSVKNPTRPVVNLLPSLDPYLMGYKDRERYLDLEYYNMIFDRSGNATSSILLDGQIIGVWDFIGSYVKIFLFNEVKASVLKEIHMKAKNIGTFISGGEVKIKQCKSMVPLTERTAGGFMSPLKQD
jgi:hypothetical protein